MLSLILWFVAVVLVVWGVIRAVGGVASSNGREVAIGVALVVVGLLVGPGGVSVLV